MSSSSAPVHRVMIKNKSLISHCFRTFIKLLQDLLKLCNIKMSIAQCFCKLSDVDWDKGLQELVNKESYFCFFFNSVWFTLKCGKHFYTEIKCRVCTEKPGNLNGWHYSVLLVTYTYDSATLATHLTSTVGSKGLNIIDIKCIFLVSPLRKQYFDILFYIKFDI